MVDSTLESNNNNLNKLGLDYASDSEDEGRGAFEEFKRLAKENEVFMLREEICSIKSAMKELDDKNGALKIENENKNQEIAKYKIILSATRSALSNMMHKAEQSSEIIRQLHTELRETNQAYGLCRDRVRDLEIEIGVAHTENQFLIEENKKLKRKYEEV